MTINPRAVMDCALFRACRLLQRSSSLALVLISFALTGSAHGVPITINYTDDAGVGFNDATLGPARQTALEFAANMWAQRLSGTVPITIDAAMASLGGSGFAALLASTVALTAHRDFPGAPQAGIWYGAALANELSGTDLNGAQISEIQTTFNSDVDGPTVLGSVSWYYGTDEQPGSDIDFVSVALHELGHGLGFFDLIDPGTGQWINGTPDVYSTFLMRPNVGGFAAMRDAERLAAITSGAVFWQGPNVVAAYGSNAPVYAPDPFQPGSSISHWDVSLSHELMAPFYAQANHEPGLLLPALADMGWQLSVPSATPVRTRTPEPTATIIPTRTPTSTPRFTPHTAEAIYVTNFDASTVSVIERKTNTITTTVAVDDGPLGVAAAPDGRSVYVTNFRAGTVSVIDTRINRVRDAIAIGAACNDVAVSPDGASIYVTTAWPDAVVVIDTPTDTVAATIPIGEQPAGIAVTPDGRLILVVNFGSGTVSVIDTRWNIVRGTIVIDPLALPFATEGALGIAIAPGGAVAYVTTVFRAAIFPVDLSQLESRPAVAPTRDTFTPQAVAIAPDGGRFYVSGMDLSYDTGIVAVLTEATSYTADRVAVGDSPSGLAVTADGATVYVANTGSNSVSAIKIPGDYVTATIPVGQAPIGVAIAQVPVVCVGDCNGDGLVTVDELLAGVSIALGNQPVSTCAAIDANGDGTVTVDELLSATDNGLNGCHD